jgi:hypothetical protein
MKTAQNDAYKIEEDNGKINCFTSTGRLFATFQNAEAFKDHVKEMIELSLLFKKLK